MKNKVFLARYTLIRMIVTTVIFILFIPASLALAKVIADDYSRFMLMQTVISLILLIICGSLLLVTMAQLGIKRKEVQAGRVFKEIFEQSSFGMGLMDQRGTILSCNIAFALMLGYISSDHLLHKKFDSFLVSEAQKREEKCNIFFEKLQSAWKNKLVTSEFSLISIDGNMLLAEVTIHRTLICKSALLMFTVYDLTERKRMEQLKDDFVGMVSHELRTPLSAIKGSIDLIIEGVAGTVSEEQKKVLETGRRNVNRLSRLINGILDLQKLRSEKIILDLQNEDMRNLIDEARTTVLQEVNSKQLNVRLDIEDDLNIIQIDRDLIMQVLINLLNNAIKFTNQGGTIGIIAKNTSKGVLVSVEDTGIGIKKEDLSRLFDSFVQVAPPLYRKTGSTGLGLTICKKIIENHRGSIWIESEYGKGSVFSFELPF